MGCSGGVLVAHDHPNAYYCPIDSVTDAAGVVYEGVVILPVTTFQRMWTGDILGSQSRTIGDFGAAIVTAHEIGHHVQDEILLQLNAQGAAVAEPTGKDKELIADCFAGVWMASAYYSGLLIDTDYDEGVTALEAIGHGGSETHGTADERRDALLVGYNGLAGVTAPGDPMACIYAYWL